MSEMDRYPGNESALMAALAAKDAEIDALRADDDVIIDLQDELAAAEAALAAKDAEIARAIEACGLAYDEGVRRGIATAEADAARLRAALAEIRSLRSQPIAKTGFSTGPQTLLDQAKRIAREALTPEDRK